MSEWRRKSTSEQFFDFLRDEILKGRWNDTIPGVHKLSSDFGASIKVAEDTLKMLEKEGFIKGQGAGKRRRIIRQDEKPKNSLRIGVLLGELGTKNREYHIELKHALNQAGHSVHYAERSMTELNMDVGRIGRMINKTKADAWIVGAGSREILEWFIDQEIPTFALFGRRRKLNIAGAGPNAAPAFAEATRRLIKLGHKRIVVLARSRQLLPEPGETEKAILNELEQNGISLSSYNMPIWGEGISGFHDCLDSLFQMTPPTALYIYEVALFVAVQQYLMNRGLTIPGDVSTIVCDYNPVLSWCKPSVSHISWDISQVIRATTRWANNVALGEQDLRQTNFKSRFVEAGTIGLCKTK